MKLFAPVAVAFGMFSRIPMPMVDWNERNMRYALCAFPLVGLVQGVLALGWGVLANYFALPALLCGAVFTVLPVLVNGGIHLDGLCDTADALASHATREKKLQILKDPHIGAFGVLSLVCHMLLTFALFTCVSLSPTVLASLGCCYILSRALSGWAVACWPPAKAEGTASSFAGASGGEAAVVLAAIALAACAILFLLQGAVGLCVILAALLVLVFYRRMAMRQFGGVTGDLAGWFLQTAELWMLAVLVLGGIVL